MSLLARCVFSTFTCTALACASQAVRAAEPTLVDPLSEAHVQRGIELREEGRSREALEEFEAAYALQPTPRNRAQIGLAHHALGEWVQAEQGLAAALADADDGWILRYREALERALAVVRRHLGWLDVETNVSNAELFVDGTSVGSLPRAEPLRLPVGSVAIEIRAPGYETLRQTSTVTANVQTRERVVLVPTPVVEEPTAPELPTPERTSNPPPADATPVKSSGRLVPGVVTLGGAGLFAVGAVVAWRLRVGFIDAYDSNACVYGNETRGTRCANDYSLQATAFAFEVGFLTGASLAAVAGGWLVATAKWRTPWKIACAPAFPLGAGCQAEF